MNQDRIPQGEEQDPSATRISLAPHPSTWRWAEQVQQFKYKPQPAPDHGTTRPDDHWFEEELKKMWCAPIGSPITADMKRAAFIALRIARGDTWDGERWWKAAGLDRADCLRIAKEHASTAARNRMEAGFQAARSRVPPVEAPAPSPAPESAPEARETALLPLAEPGSRAAKLYEALEAVAGEHGYRIVILTPGMGRKPGEQDFALMFRAVRFALGAQPFNPAAGTDPIP